MSDYIKREDAMKTLADEYDECEFKRYAEGLFKDIPAEDVAPVRHGRWEQASIFYGEDGSPCIADVCTECGAYGDYADFKYCPNCGARMDGENDETD